MCCQQSLHIDAAVGGPTWRPSCPVTSHRDARPVQAGRSPGIWRTLSLEQCECNGKKGNVNVTHVDRRKLRVLVAATGSCPDLEVPGPGRWETRAARHGGLRGWLDPTCNHGRLVSLAAVSARRTVCPQSLMGVAATVLRQDRHRGSAARPPSAAERIVLRAAWGHTRRTPHGPIARAPACAPV